MWSTTILNTFCVKTGGNEAATGLGKQTFSWNHAPTPSSIRKMYSELYQKSPGWQICFKKKQKERQSLHFPEKGRGHSLPIAAPPWMYICLSNRLKHFLLFLTFKALEGLLPSALYKLWASPCLQGFEGMELWTLGLSRTLKGLYISLSLCSPRQGRIISHFKKAFRSSGPLGTLDSSYIWVL